MPDISSDGLRAGLAEAESALAALAAGPARTAADSLAQAFDQAGARIGAALGKAAATGELSFRQLGRSVLGELTKLAANAVFGSSGLLAGALKSLPFFGARAAGGSVAAGGAYLVGERGPELFTPASAGTISSGAGAPMAIHLHFNGPADVEGFRREQGQIAAALARAAAYGRRNL